MAPAEARQIIAHGFGQIAHIAIRFDAQCAVPLRQFGTIGTVNERDMRELRHLPIQRGVNLRLARRIGQMVIAANNMGDAHIMVVHHDRQHIGRRAVGTQQHQIVKLRIVGADAALHRVIYHRLTTLRRFEAHHKRRAVAVLVAARAVITRRLAGGARRLAHRLYFLRRAGAFIGFAFVQKPLGNLDMAGRVLVLEQRRFIGIKAEPGHAVENGINGLLGRAGAVSILDAQQKSAAVMARKSPVEKSRARAANVQKAGRRGRETSDDFGGVGH